MKRISNSDLIQKLFDANNSIRIIGVIGLGKVDWQNLSKKWKENQAGNPDFRVSILCESDNFLFSQAFIFDNEFATKRLHFEDLKFLRERVADDLSYLNWLDSGERSENFLIEILYTPISQYIVEIDGNIYMNLWIDNPHSEYEEIESTDEWLLNVNSYIENCFNIRIGRKYASTKLNSANEIIETLELYDHNRIPRGIYPRNSFYDTDYSQLVVWALIFDRHGKLLIHRRSDNAKDNKSMWDKSVGGHVDFSLDIDTSRAILREVIEELFTDENIKEYKFFDVTDEEMIYMGEWRPKQRRNLPFHEINSYKKEWAFFRLKNSQHLYSPRTTKNGTIRRLRVISDVYLFIANKNLNDDTLKDLKNSKFKLIELSDLKSAMDMALKKEPIIGFDEKLDIPLFTPDLTNILTGELRDVLQEFSQYIKYYSEN